MRWTSSGRSGTWTRRTLAQEVAPGADGVVLEAGGASAPPSIGEGAAHPVDPAVEAGEAEAAPIVAGEQPQAQHRVGVDQGVAVETVLGSNQPSRLRRSWSASEAGSSGERTAATSDGTDVAARHRVEPGRGRD